MSSLNRESVLNELGAIAELVTLDAVEATGSTNADLIERSSKGAPDWSVLIADHQTSGRGRHQRPWSSPSGGLYASVLLRLPLDSPPITLIPLVAGLALSGAIREISERENVTLSILMKWPNDIHTPDGKLAGILCETSQDSARWTVVIGSGLNITPLTTDLRSLLSQPVTSLMEEADSIDWSREIILGAYLRHLYRWIETWRNDPQAVRTMYEEQSSLRGRHIRVNTGNGIVEGIVEGINEIGGLVLRGESGLTAIHAAEGIEEIE